MRGTLRSSGANEFVRSREAIDIWPLCGQGNPMMAVSIFVSRVRTLAALGVMLLTSIHCRDASGQTATPTPPPVPRHDTQQWNDVQLIVPMTSKVDFILLGALRLGLNLSHPVDDRIG